MLHSLIAFVIRWFTVLWNACLLFISNVFLLMIRMKFLKLSCGLLDIYRIWLSIDMRLDSCNIIVLLHLLLKLRVQGLQMLPVIMAQPKFRGMTSLQRYA